MSTRRIVLALLLGAAACDESPVSLPEPAGVTVAAATMALAVGDQAPVAAQVVDQDGRVMQGQAVVYSTDDPSVATVDNVGMVRGVAPGTANVSAAYGNRSATVQVTVVANRRSELQSLDLLADSLIADRRAGVQVVAVRAVNGFGQAVCPELTLRSSDPSIATARMAGACRIEVSPLFAGETTITATSVGGRTDSFRVRVTSSGQLVFFSARPTSEQLVAGAAVSYTVKALDQNNQPIANQRVSFDVSVGSLSATSATTDSTGTATVRWQIPTNLRDWGQNQSISYRAVLSNGTVAARTENVFINGASLHEIVLYRDTGSGWTRLDAASITTPGWSYVYLGAGGLDQYGNTRATDFTFAITGTYYGWTCGGSGGTLAASGIEYTCYYAPSNTTSTLTASAPSGASRSVQVNFTG